MNNKNNANTNGILHWGRKEMISDAQNSYYDLTYYKVPFSGDYEPHKMRTMLSKRYPNTGNYFGGYTTVGSVERLDDQHVKVELVHHIGN